MIRHSILFLALSSVTAFSQQYLTGGTDFNFVSSTANLNPGFSPWNNLANLGNGSTANDAGVVFQADGSDEWEFSFNEPATITGIDLWTRVGGALDNGVRNFTVSFFSGSTLLGTESESAALDADWQSFSSATYTGVTNFSVNFTSNFGSAGSAEVNEIRFATPVPEPSAALLGMGAVCGMLATRRRRALTC